MIIHINTKSQPYDICLARGALYHAKEHFNLGRRVLVVTDGGVPPAYAKAVCDQCGHPFLFTVESGEASKSLATVERLCRHMLNQNFTRGDCVVAVGGGVVGDLAAFTASVYMRGIDFYNIPTTLLSQVDSSIGGKTAVNFEGVKNIIGTFRQPNGVLIDPDVLSSLPPRQISNGLAESIKMSLTCDADLFSVFESGNAVREIDTVILRSLMIKRDVVEKDELEGGLRKILNFGHTIGHGIESEEELHGMYHGECVALGMIPMCAPDVAKRLIAVEKSIGLPCRLDYDTEKVIAAMSHDKKIFGKDITVTYVREVGKYELITLSFEELCDRTRKAFDDEKHIR